MKFAKVRRYFVDQYMTIDARSLGFGRIVLALILLLDLLRRIPDLTLFYSNDGLIPNHMMLWRPPTQWMFSFFFILSRPDEVAVGFAVCGLVYLGLLLGWRTRLMQVLALICVLSLHSRVTLLENGGDWMLGELALWTAFLPLGRRFSLDAVRASLRARRETTAAELGDRNALEVHGRFDASCRWRCSRSRCRSPTRTSSTRFTRAGRPGGRGPPCTTCCTRTAWSPGLRSGCGRTCRCGCRASCRGARWSRSRSCR